MRIITMVLFKAGIFHSKRGDTTVCNMDKVKKNPNVLNLNWKCQYELMIWF